MDYYEAQKIFKDMYPDILVSFEFDDKCIRQIECIYTDGKMHIENHIQYEKVKVTPKGHDSIYIPIIPHRMLISCDSIKKKISQDEIYLNQSQVEYINKMIEEKDPLLDTKVSELAMISGLSREEILERCKE